MKLYLVMYCFYDDFSIKGIFSTLEKAEKYIYDYSGYEKKYLSINEYILDDTSEENND